MSDATQNQPEQPNVAPPLPADFNFYQPQLKKGTHRLLVTVADFEPAIGQDGSYIGWTFTGTLKQEAPDDSEGGQGKLPIGTKMPRATMFVGTGYRTREEAQQFGVACIMGLNNIAVNRRNQASCKAALAAYNALSPEKQLPFSHEDDTNPDHFKQWIGTDVVAVYNSKLDNEGNTKVNCFGLEAASTAKL